MIWLNRLTKLFWKLLLDALMGPGSIEGLAIGVKDTVQLLLLQDEQVIETLSTDCAGYMRHPLTVSLFDKDS